MKRKIITTGDGSKTIQIEEWHEQYHSKHGALQEAQHVFIKSGLHHFCNSNPKKKQISILEIGFGTGLNAFLTLLEAEVKNVDISYVGIEAFPVQFQEIRELNYPELIDSNRIGDYIKLHKSPWETKEPITVKFDLLKRNQLISHITDQDSYDLVYFDAFGAKVQPELWTKDIFQRMYNAIKPNGVLVTYAAIGKVRRDMTEIGFVVERIEGPPGKRHMLRATKM